MLQVYEVRGAWGVPSLSPFCVKLTTWLRMAGVAHVVKQPSAPFGSPKGKVPYIVLDDGARMGDSGLVIAHLTAVHGVQLDAHLSLLQRAQAHALRRMLEEGLYFVLLYGRWIDDIGWPHTRAAIFGFLPQPLRMLVPAMIRSKVRGYLHGQGTGRHSQAEIEALGRGDINALATVLGDQPYFFGEPSSFDASAYGFLVNLLASPAMPGLKAHAANHANLVAYCERMRARYWPESPVLEAVAQLPSPLPSVRSSLG